VHGPGPGPSPSSNAIHKDIFNGIDGGNDMLWYGFSKPRQVSQLASWVEYQGKLADFEARMEQDRKSGGGDGGSSSDAAKDLAGLVAGLKEWADWSAWRWNNPTTTSRKR
jgi:hypothetical protein